MKTSFQRCLAIVTGAALLVSLLSACVVEGGGGYSYDSGVDVGVDYYQPVGGVVVGSWGPGYHVGPPRGGDDHRGDDHRGDDHRSPGAPGNSAPHAYRPAPPSHSAPSIPSHGRK